MPCVTGQGSLVGFLLVAFGIREWPPKETAPARGQAEAEVEAGVPHIGTIAMWVSYPPIPLNSFSEIREWPKILAWRQLEPSARYDAGMNAEGLFQVEPVK
jgi:hypothetical protein